MELRFILAQIAADWGGTIAQFGVAGSMLFWFATRVESRMKAMETSIDRMAKAAILQILSYERHETTIGIQAKSMLAEIDRKEGNRPQ